MEVVLCYFILFLIYFIKYILNCIYDNQKLMTQSFNGYTSPHKNENALPYGFAFKNIATNLLLLIVVNSLISLSCKF